MSRRDTIIIAVIINAGLLIVLFVSALKSHNGSHEIAASSAESLEPVNELALRHQAAAQGDEVDQVLHQYSQAANEQQPLVASSSAAAPAVEPQAAPVDSIFAEVQNVAPPSMQPFAEQPSLAATAFSSVERVESAIHEVTVKKGDVLEKIARTNHTTVDEIMKFNHLANTRLKIGQILKIPSKNGKKAEDLVVATKTNAPATPKYYTVKNGDNPWTIAVKNHMKVDELLKLNNLDEEKARRLKAGDRLRIK
jgi:LysM repeat protein